MSLCGGVGWRDYPAVWFAGSFEFSGSLERQGCAVPDGLNFVEVVFSGSLNRRFAVLFRAALRFRRMVVGEGGAGRGLVR